MSTTIDVYPTTATFTLVEQTRARTEELFNELLRRHGLESVVTVHAYVMRDGATVPVPEGMVWAIDTHLVFEYAVDGDPRACSWPSCRARDDEDIDEDTGNWFVIDELRGRVDESRLEAADVVGHHWYE
ncbi:hypothetical protein [Salana multivorans]